MLTIQQFEIISQQRKILSPFLEFVKLIDKIYVPQLHRQVCQLRGNFRNLCHRIDPLGGDNPHSVIFFGGRKRHFISHSLGVNYELKYKFSNMYSNFILLILSQWIWIRLLLFLGRRIKDKHQVILWRKRSWKMSRLRKSGNATLTMVMSSFPSEITHSFPQIHDFCNVHNFCWMLL